MAVSTPDFRSIRQWHGSQYQAFEELCYQLRDPTPKGAELIKTGNPDAGLEWYVSFRNGVQRGWQAKFIFDIDTLLKSMEKSLRTVAKDRPKCRRLAFCIPFDLPDASGSDKLKSARQKFEDRKASWRQRIPGAERVRIDLWSAGDLLQRLVGHPNQRGIEKFFWDEEVFSPDWCARRMQKTSREAGGRYTPELHVDLPVAFELAGLARSEAYWQRLVVRRGAVLKAASYLTPARFTGLGVTRQLQRLAKSLYAWRRTVPSCIELPAPIDAAPLLGVTHAVQEAAYAVSSHDNSLRSHLHGLLTALQDFEALLEGDATKAAGHGALLLTGEAGQGKTHLFCDTVQRALNVGQPAVLLFGGRFSGRRVWSEMAEQLGLGQAGSEVLIGAMQAAAEASNAPFLLLIDALNESENPRAWQDELPSLLAEVAQHPWISIGVSVRSTYREIVLPADGLSGIAEVDHRGFAGYELEATEQFFDAFGLEQPGIPLLAPEFTNPLFLKLYCEGWKGRRLNVPPAGETHVSDVFEQYLKSKGDRIANRLNLDPATRPVQSAIDAFCDALAEANRDTLARGRATEIINAFAPGRNQWPETMLGALLSESVLTADLARDSGSGELVDVIRFTYQRFADYRIGSVLLEPFEGDSERLREALADGEPLRKRSMQAPAGWIEALAVQIPERFGIELLDVVQWQSDFPRRRWWDGAFVKSIATRRPSAVTDRSRELLREVQRRSGSKDLFELVLETILSVAPSPGNPLNANFLHEWLRRLPMPERDVAWSIPTYFAFDYGGTLDRLIRWAARGPYSNCSNEVLELAAIPIVWTFTSPNRRMRDHATKALAKLLSGHPQVLPSLIRHFDGIDDPYVIERLAVVAHGAVLCGGSSAPQEALTVAEALERVALAEIQVPNIITRDAVRGVYEWCRRHQLIKHRTYEEVLPPYGSAPPEEPRTAEELRQRYDREEIESCAGKFPYGSVLGSIFCMGDFGDYVIRPKIQHFGSHRLSLPRPRIGEEETYPEELARRWVFERVLSLGWTPEKFGEFDNDRYTLDSGEHKAERFGKKYQWVALRELIARVADNFRMTTDSDHQAVTYAGPWQFFGRDIDPTLPPPHRLRNEDGEFDLGPTFTEDKTWWLPPGPSYHRDDPPVGKGWAVDSSDMPEFEPLSRRQDERNARWVVLRAHYRWDDKGPENEELNSRPRRRLWSQTYGWLVQPDDREALVAYLEEHSLIGRWMPEGGGHTDAAHFGEVPWATAADAYPGTWEEVRARGGQPASIEVYPAWSEYLWEGNVLDCSIDEGVSAWFPSLILFKRGKLAWVPGAREWRAPNGLSVARYFERGAHMSLLVREDWLKRTLRKTSYSMVFGWLGEKRLLAPYPGRRPVGDWTDINGVASLAGNQWKFGERRLERRSPRT